MPFQCYLEKDGLPCGQIFESKRKLKEHMQPAPHRIMRVVCPFCFDRETTYNRAADLKAHVLKRHEEAPSGVGVPIDNLLSENNCFWLSYHPADYRALVEPTEKESRASVRIRTLLLEWTRKVAGGAKRGRQQWLDGWEEPAKVIPFKKSVPPPPVEEYDPTKPDISQMEVRSISLTPGSITAVLKEGSKWVRVHLEDSLLLDAKSVASVSRKLAFIVPGEEGPTSDSYKPQADPTIQRLAASALGVDAKFVAKIEVAACPVTPSSRGAACDLPKEPELDLFAESDIDVGSPIPSAEVMNMPTPTYHPTPLETTRPPSPKRKRQDKEMHILRKPASNPTPPKERTQVISSSDTLAPSTERKRPRPVSSVVNTPKPTAAGDQGSLQERAKNLLARGCMPLMPPARRQWGERQVTLTNGSVQITWPPVNFKALTQDQKLLELEFTALSLVRGKQAGSCPIERAELLDEFNFLALPGTVPLSPKKLQKPHLKSRVYMYQAVRAIANGDSDTKGDEELVSFLEGAASRRRRTWDHLISIVDAAGVLLRLKDEN